MNPTKTPFNEESQLPAGKPPTERRRRLGAELRKMREHVGLSLTEATRIHRTHRPTVSNTESGRFGVSPIAYECGPPTTPARTAVTSTSWQR